MMKQIHSRIMIFGRPGSGKSTFATKLHQKTKIPLYHLDRYSYCENWDKHKHDKSLLAVQHELVNKNSWIIDGNTDAIIDRQVLRSLLTAIAFWRRLVSAVRMQNHRPSVNHTNLR